MSHFAKVENGIVTQVIVAEEDVIATGIFGHGWIQTSYNTFGNQHPNGTPLRGNYAGIGYTYDAENDVFIAPKPYDNWILDTASWLWQPPIPMPVNEYYQIWNQEQNAWIQGELRPIPEPVVEPVVEEPVVEAVVEAPAEVVPEAVAEVAPEVTAEVIAEVPVEAVVEAPVVEPVTPTEPTV